MAQLVIEIKGPQGAGKSEAFKSLCRFVVRNMAGNKTLFAFDGEGQRMTPDDKKKAAKADILIVTKQTYKLRKRKK